MLIILYTQNIFTYYYPSLSNFSIHKLEINSFQDSCFFYFYVSFELIFLAGKDVVVAQKLCNSS